MDMLYSKVLKVCGGKVWTKWIRNGKKTLKVKDREREAKI